MKKETLQITVFTNDEAHCLVNEEKMKIGLAKTIFGDWDKLDDYKEKQRRRFRGNAHYEFEVTEATETQQIQVEDTKTIKENDVEAEFPGLKVKSEDKEEPKDELLELNDEQCSAITKSGKQCKMEKAEGSDLCSLHKSKQDKK